MVKKRKGRLPSYLGYGGSYQKTVKGGPTLISRAESKFPLKKYHISATEVHVEKHKSRTPLILRAKSKFALKTWKGRLPSYLGNRCSYKKLYDSKKL